MQRAEKIIDDNLDTLHRLATALLDREILDGEEIDKIIRGEELPAPRKGDGQALQMTGNSEDTKTPTAVQPLAHDEGSTARGVDRPVGSRQPANKDREDKK
jgi:cell division protease FtsH